MYYTERQIRGHMAGIAAAALGVGAAGWLGAWWLLAAWLATLGGALAGLYGLVSTRTPSPSPAPAGRPGLAAPGRLLEPHSYPPAPPIRRPPPVPLKPRFKPVNLYSTPAESGDAPFGLPPFDPPIKIKEKKEPPPFGMPPFRGATGPWIGEDMPQPTQDRI